MNHELSFLVYFLCLIGEYCTSMQMRMCHWVHGSLAWMWSKLMIEAFVVEHLQVIVPLSMPEKALLFILACMLVMCWSSIVPHIEFPLNC